MASKKKQSSLHVVSTVVDKSVALVAAESNTEAAQETVARKIHKTKSEIFQRSLDKIPTTGNIAVDSIGKKVLSAIFLGEMAMTGSEAEGFTGVYNGKAPVAITKEAKGKSVRYILTVGEGEQSIRLGGTYAAKAFNYSRAQHRPESIASFNEEAVSAVAALLD
jgi:hypothetical protein